MGAIEDNLSKSAVENVRMWLELPKYAEYKEEVESMVENGRWKELEDSFFKVIEFGTAGRRGTTGPGSNRINRVTIGESAQALCTYVKEFDSQAPEKGIVIAFDTRVSSPELSRYTAQVCSANGFKTYIFDSFRSTPELSFAVRHLGCSAGIVVSASHNPPADNGFKAYWSDGAQIVPPHDRGVLDAASKLTEIHAEASFEEAIEAGRIVIVGKEVDEAYFEAVLAQSENDERDLKIVYSPLHGAGQTSVLPALKRAGFKDIVTVDEQMVPDGNFPTIPNGKPNPQEPIANEMAIKKMLEVDADIAITNDPDADRIGVIVNHHGKAVALNGNQSVALATDYSLRKLQEKGELTPNRYVVRTIVTTDMIDALANKYGVKVYNNLLVGFKYVGELIKSKEQTEERFVIGGEESYGMLKGDYARDKDGATGALPLAELSAELKKDGKTLIDRLMELYSEVGLFVEKTDTVSYPGAEGFEKMKHVMQSLRQSPPTKIGEYEVTTVLDYKTLERKNAYGSVEQINSINGDVFALVFGDERRRITVRPSGTEPSLKLYIQWYEPTEDPENDYARVLDELESLHTVLSSEVL